MTGQVASYHDFLHCRVNRIEHDFTNHHGKLRVASGASPGMDEVIALFLALDPALLEVIVFAGGRSTWLYRRDKPGTWMARDIQASERA
jgi:hypothetical protein